MSLDAAALKLELLRPHGAAAGAPALAEDARPRPFPVVRVLEGPAPAPPAVHIADFAIDCDINLCIAPGAAAKSTLLSMAAVCVVLNRPLFGTLAVLRPGPVLLVVPEDGQIVTRNRLDAIAKGLGVSAAERAVLEERLVMIADDSVVSIVTDAHRLAQTALDHHAVMVIIDPLRNVLGTAAENDNDVAGACCDTLRRVLCRGAGVSVLMAHHNRKPTRDAEPNATPSMHDARGAGGWVNGARLVLGVDKKGNRLVVTGLKSNRIKADLRHELDLAIEADPQNPAHWLSCRITDANAGATRGMQSDAYTPGKGRPLNANEFTLLSGLNDSQEPDKRFSHAQWQGVARGEGIKDDTFKSIKNRLIDAHLATKIATGKKTRTGSPEYVYQITESGRSELAKGERVSEW